MKLKVVKNKMESNFGETYEAPQEVHEIEETLSVNRYEDPSCVAVFYSILSHVSSLKNLSLDRNNEEMTCYPRGIFLVMMSLDLPFQVRQKAGVSLQRNGAQSALKIFTIFLVLSSLAAERGLGTLFRG